MEQELLQEYQPEKALLISVDTGEFDAEASLNELAELTKSAGAVPVASLLQKRPTPDAATCVGPGRLEEIRNYCENLSIQLLIFDRELSPTQIRNLERETDCRVIDRTTLILDIFASRARSKEGKLQVELAQLKYLLPRLSGKGTSLSRLGAGIGTRGPGESKLETDRRHIRRRIESLNKQLLQVGKRREQLRAHRRKIGVITVALVGYTNAGKSTLMNLLTSAGVLAEDRLFATLDPTSRALTLPNGMTVMLIDTVGLVRRLPHHLVEAFHSTLEEAALADVILNVCDASSPEASIHLEVTRKILEDLGCSNRPIISVMNKCDLIGFSGRLPPEENEVCISAKTGEGISLLLESIQQHLPVQQKQVELLLPYDQGNLLGEIRRFGRLLSEEYREDGIYLSAMVDAKLYHRVREYRIG